MELFKPRFLRVHLLESQLVLQRQRTKYKERCLASAVARRHRVYTSVLGVVQDDICEEAIPILIGSNRCCLDESTVAFVSRHVCCLTWLQLLSREACGPVLNCKLGSSFLEKSPVTQLSSCMRACSSALFTSSVLALQLSSLVLASITVESCGQSFEVCVTLDLLQSHSLANTKQK